MRPHLGLSNSCSYLPVFIVAKLHERNGKEYYIIIHGNEGLNNFYDCLVTT